MELSELVLYDERREQRTMLNVVMFVARFAYPFLIGFMLGLLAPR